MRISSAHSAERTLLRGILFLTYLWISGSRYSIVLEISNENKVLDLRRQQVSRNPTEQPRSKPEIEEANFIA